MYNNKQLLLKAIELLKAVKNNNLKLTQEIVEDLNKDFNVNKTSNIQFNNILINDNIKNESYVYILYNLKYLTNIEIVQWNFEIKELLNNLNKQEMLNFVETILNSNEDIPQYKKSALNQICITIDRYDLLQQIKTKIKE